jgi:hypothetical protein
MCMAIYILLLGLLLYYSDYVLEQYALSVAGGEEQWMVVAIGWEMVPLIWPVALLLLIAGSATTLFLLRIFSPARRSQE